MAAEHSPHAHSVPPVVRQALRSPGRPLENATRAFMEPRFGHDFSHVRVHTDATAAASARAVQALAYTVGRDVVFGEGQYRPGSDAGRRLIAHELAHTLQQRGETDRISGPLELAPQGDAAEKEAEAAADAIARGQTFSPVLRRSSQVAREGEGTKPKEGCVCGPNVTAQTKAAVNKIMTTFDGWTPDVKYLHCSALNSVLTAGEAWDINELHNQQWIKRYRPQCATPCPGDHPCGKFYPDEVKKVKEAQATVQIDSSCHYAGSVNYVSYGVMCRLCFEHFTALAQKPDNSWFFKQEMESAASDFTENAMLQMLHYYKGPVPLLRAASGNYNASRAWASSGWNGWPAHCTSPAGDRPGCAPTCPLAYGSVPLPTDGTADPGIGTGPFSVHWIQDPTALSDADKKKGWF